MAILAFAGGGADRVEWELGDIYMTPGWIDIHTHLNMLKINTDAVLAQAAAADVQRMVTIGTEPGDHQIVFNLAEKYFPKVACTLGVHPHEAILFNEDVEQSIRSLATAPHVVAIGEIGLDYYYESSPRDVQKEAFRKQLRIAQDLSLPVEIHTRDAEEDTLEILREFSGSVRGVLHCFTGTAGMAAQAIELGLDISISGVVTFKNADSLRAIAKSLPKERFHIETDAPFLSPVPFRGKQNEPSFLPHTAKVVCELRNVQPIELQDQLKQNASKLFSKWQIQ